ncbi:MAG: tetratricopeptide repeat protein [Treponema sp.]|jgi:tetratricopeptide (TPR) repeat protein|nr:tetratricopeptide repeat protein [Treponema sp.]
MSPLDVKDLLERARGAARVGDYEEAGRLLKTYTASHPDKREAYLLLGTAQVKMGNLEEAEALYSGLIKQNSRDVEALNNLAVIYRRRGSPQTALDKLLDAVEIEPDRAEFYYNIGIIHNQQGNLQAAAAAYAKVVEMDANFVPAYNNLGAVYTRLQDWQRAFQVFQQGLALDRNNPFLHFNYGLALETKGKLAEAEKEYTAAVRVKPGMIAPLHNLGIVYFKQGRHEKAQAVFTHILKLEPDNLAALNNLGAVLADQGTEERRQEAIRCFQRALALNSGYTKGAVNLAWLYLQAEQYHEAEAWIADLLAADSLNAGALRVKQALEERRGGEAPASTRPDPTAGEQAAGREGRAGAPEDRRFNRFLCLDAVLSIPEVPEELLVEDWEDDADEEDLPLEKGFFSQFENGSDAGLLKRREPGGSPKPPQARDPARTRGEGTPGAEELENKKILALLRYLKGLAAALPGPLRAEFSHNNARLGMEYLMVWLEGRKGLYRDRAPEAPRQSRSAQMPVNLDDTERTLTYLARLTVELPDPDLGSLITQKVHSIINAIRRSVITGG